MMDKERAIIGARVSTKDQADRGFSLPEQVAAGRTCIQERGYELADIPGFSTNGIAKRGVFQEDFTGMSMDRPAIEAMREAVAQHNVTVIVFTELDRLARRAIYQTLLEEEFADLGARIEYVYDRYDETDEGVFFKGVKKELAEYERKKQLRKLTNGKRGRVKAGKILPGCQPPYGYDYNPSTGTLSINEEEAEVVRLVFEWFVYGDETSDPLPSQRIATLLRERSVAPRGNGSTRFLGYWSGTMVCNMLANETYTGEWYYNKTKTVEKIDPQTGEKKTIRNVKRPRSEWLGPVSVPTIIEPELFAAARERAGRNLAFSKRNRKRTFLYSSLLLCDHCKRSFQALDPKQKGLFYYRCNGRRHKAVTCDMPYFNERDLHNAIWPWFAKLIDDPEEVIRAMRAGDDAKVDELAHLRLRLSRIEQKIGELQRRIESVDDELEVEADAENKESLRARKAQRTKERQDFEKERAEITEQLSYQAHSEEQLSDIRTRCERFRSRLQNPTREQMRELLVLFEVKARLAVEDGQKVAHVSCKLGSDRVVIEKPSSRRR
jgi:site-specific DNA recombinase